MYEPELVILTLIPFVVIAATIGYSRSETVRKIIRWFAVLVGGAAVAAMFVMICFVCMDAARADEVRTAYIADFDLQNGDFILEDEDGYLWAFGFQKDEYYLGDEYTLHLEEDSDPWYEKGDENQWLRPLSSISGDLLKNVGVRLRSRVSSLY